MSLALANRIESATDNFERPVDEPVLDREYLAKFTLGDAALEQEVLQLFRDHSVVQLAQLRDAAGDPKRWHDASHGIKGSARGIGAKALGQAAAHAENDKDQSAATHLRHVDLIAERLQATYAAIDGLYHAG